MSICGDTRAWKKSNRMGVMDQIVFLPHGQQIFVEVKTPDGRMSQPQQREAARLRGLNAQVTCVYGTTGVDEFIKDVVDFTKKIKDEYR